MKTAYSYLRVSGKSQIEGDGFPRQRDCIARYAQRSAVEIAQEFVEEAVSGTKDAFDREAYPALILAIKSSDVRLVLVERADRLARDLMVSEILLDEFRKLGVKVIAADDGTDLTVEDGNPTKTLLRQMLGAVSQWEKSVIVQKLRAARVRMKKETGRCEGRKPYGHTDHERGVIQRMKSAQSLGYSLTSIASILNTEGIKPRGSIRAGKETKWHPTAVARILAANP